MRTTTADLIGAVEATKRRFMIPFWLVIPVDPALLNRSQLTEDEIQERLTIAVERELKNCLR